MRERKYGEPVLVGQVLKDYLARTHLGRHLAASRVFKAWQAAAGPTLSQRAQAVRFERGELLVEVRSSAHLHELSNFSGERYRRTANQQLGEELIRRIVFQIKR